MFKSWYASLPDDHPRKLRKSSQQTNRRRNLMSKFGITLEQYDEMAEQQGGVCAICKQPNRVKHGTGATKRLAVDHCHLTGTVRGLLCDQCNRGLGLFGDDPDRLRNASAYCGNMVAGDAIANSGDDNGDAKA